MLKQRFELRTKGENGTSSATQRVESLPGLHVPAFAVPSRLQAGRRHQLGLFSQTRQAEQKRRYKDCRTPRRFAFNEENSLTRGSVLECGSPLPLLFRPHDFNGHSFI